MPDNAEMLYSLFAFCQGRAQRRCFRHNSIGEIEVYLGIVVVVLVAAADEGSTACINLHVIGGFVTPFRETHRLLSKGLYHKRILL